MWQYMQSELQVVYIYLLRCQHHIHYILVCKLSLAMNALHAADRKTVLPVLHLLGRVVNASRS